MDLPLDPRPDTLQTDWPATRAEGLRRLEAFRPRMGRHYRDHRNDDLGPKDRSNVSVLSPWLARRIVTEEETVAAALSRHSPAAAEKFVQEVFWRSYFKGWLERRPSVWTDYRTGLAGDRAAVARDRGLARRLAEAEEGRTGIDAFDAWAAELAATGYLHNHARMWFASIWIFTLGLPWRLGADFFLRHLLDGDAASNTLGWRWVAGLHTLGKNYAATAANIRKHTAGRFDPKGLARDPGPLAGEPHPRPAALRPVTAPAFREPTGLLLTCEDLGVETMPLPAGLPVATLRLTEARSDAPVAEAVAAFDRAALADAAARAGAPDAPQIAPGEVADWARSVGVARIATGYLHTGWVRDRLAPALARSGVALEEMVRPWDEAVWPHATAGFFRVKSEIPAVLRARGLAA